MRHLLPFLWIPWLLSCDLFDLPLTVEAADEKLVISSVMIGNQTMVVTATRSFSPLSGRSMNALEEDLISSLFVNQGLVILSQPNATDTLPSLGIPGFFGGSTALSAFGSQITISVFDSSTGLRVEASATRMPAIGIDRSEYRDVSLGNLDLKRLRVWIEDPAGPNFYAMHVYNLPLSTDGTLDSLYFQDEDLLLHSEVFTDRVAADGVIRRQVDLNPTLAGDTLIVVLSNIEEGYYRFLDARRRTGGVVASLANEPINAPSNVKGGYGYFSAHQLRARVVRKNESLTRIDATGAASPHHRPPLFPIGEKSD